MVVKKPQIILLVLFLISFISTTGFVFAQKPLEVTYPEFPGVDITATKPVLPAYVKYIFNFSIMIAGLIAFGALVYGGFRYLTSAGSPAAIADAKDQILAAFLGLIILLCSYLILVTINSQLTMLDIVGLEKYLYPEKEVPPPVEEKEKFVFFQIPTGKIIEKAILYTEAQESFDTLISLSKDLEKETQKLRDLSEDLKVLTDACKCNQSNCSAINSETGQGCLGLGCPWAFCDKEAIKNKIEEIKTTIKEINTTREEMVSPQSLVSYNLLELQKAAALMSLLSEEIGDYNTMLTDRYFMEEAGTKVEFAYFPGWEDIKVEVKGNLVNDPATFYFDKEQNEDIIKLVEDLVGEAINPPPAVLPPPPPPPAVRPSGLLSINDLRQNDPRWKETQINACNDKLGVYSPPCTALSGCGCGPTSLAMVLRYFGKDIYPLDIARAVRKNREYFCGLGSSLSGLAKMADSNYGVPYYQSSFDNLSGHLDAGRPVIASCKNFGRGYPGYKNGWGHISVIKGIKDGYVYFQDPYVGEVVFAETVVKNNFNCSAYYAFGP